MLECSIEDRFAPLSINAGQPGEIANPDMYDATFLIGHDKNRKFIDDVASRNVKVRSPNAFVFFNSHFQ